MGINTFILGLTADLDRRCENLQALLSVYKPHKDVSRLHSRITTMLAQTRKKIRSLQKSNTVHHPELWSNALSDYQDLVHEFTVVEQLGVPILTRYNKEDERGSALVRALAHQIGFPQDLIPVVTATSDAYYWAEENLRIVGIPASDLKGVLGWPDLLHELAHLLLAARRDFLAGFSPIVKEYFKEQRERMADIGSSPHENRALAIAQLRWGEGQTGTWRLEFAADLVATYLVGPSYAWQHLRLTMNHGDDPFTPSPPESTSHPAPQARLDEVAAMLRLLKCEQEAKAIQLHWANMLHLTLYDQLPPGFRTYYPTELMKTLAELVFTSCQREGLVPFANETLSQSADLISLINAAWLEFNCNPTTYVSWENQAVQTLDTTIFALHPMQN